MAVRHAVGLLTVGEFGDVQALLDLAVTAERHGWDGGHLRAPAIDLAPLWPVHLVHRR
jgi:hypothetical protein